MLRIYRLCGVVRGARGHATSGRLCEAYIPAIRPSDCQSGWADTAARSAHSYRACATLGGVRLIFAREVTQDRKQQGGNLRSMERAVIDNEVRDGSDWVLAAIVADRLLEEMTSRAPIEL